MHTLYLDKAKEFVCEVQIKNASTKGSKARLVVESSEGTNFIFNGKIEGGMCIIPIKKLKGLLDENSTGKISLEIIVEDMFFSPWSDTFLIEEHTSVKVKVNEQLQSTKPIVTVKVQDKPQKTIIKKRNIKIPIREAIKLT